MGAVSKGFRPQNRQEWAFWKGAEMGMTDYELRMCEFLANDLRKSVSAFAANTIDELLGEIRSLRVRVAELEAENDDLKDEADHLHGLVDEFS